MQEQRWALDNAVLAFAEIVYFSLITIKVGDKNLRSAVSDNGLASMFILLILSLLSLFSLSLFRTSMNNYYIVRNEVVSQQSFYRAQSVADQMVDMLRAIHIQHYSEIKDLSSHFTWITNEQRIDLKNVGRPSFWQQLTSKKFPPDAQAVAVLLNTHTDIMPSESLIMTNDRHIQTCYFTILAKAEISGSTSIVELGLRKRIVQ